MSNTHHHGSKNHQGHDYGGKYKCNKHYGQGYGKFGRQLAARERRNDDKKAVNESIREGE